MIAGFLLDLIKNGQRLSPKEFIYLGGISAHISGHAPAFACGGLQSMVTEFSKCQDALIVSTFCRIFWERGSCSSSHTTDCRKDTAHVKILSPGAVVCFPMRLVRWCVQHGGWNVPMQPFSRAFLSSSAQGRCLLLYPGGAREALKGSNADKYKLMWNDKLVSATMEHGFNLVGKRRSRAD